MHNVLVIDDEADVRDGIKRVLERAGFSVRVIDNAGDVLPELRRQQTDIVVTDIIMPKMSGVEAIAAILREFPEMRILAISGGGNFDMSAYQSTAITTTTYLSAAQTAGAHAILRKPFESLELIQAVEQLIAPS